MLRSLALLLLVAATTSHVCILEPPQRGPLSVVTAGDPSCYRRTGPCGGVARGSAPGTPFVAGVDRTIRVHQNLVSRLTHSPHNFQSSRSHPLLSNSRTPTPPHTHTTASPLCHLYQSPVCTGATQNHWTPPQGTRTSGYFTLSLVAADPSGDADGSAPAVLLDTWSDYPSWDEVAQTNFTRTITVPADAAPGPAILAFAYVSYNVDEVDPPINLDAIFYNCADIVVVAGEPAAVGDGTVAGEPPAAAAAAATVAMAGAGAGTPQPSCLCIKKPTCAAGEHAAATGNCGNHGQYPYYCCTSNDGLRGAAGAMAEAAAAAAAAAVQAADINPSSAYTCTTPDRWSAQGLETMADGAFVSHHIVVDSVAQQMYWSRKKSRSNNGDGGDGVQGAVSSLSADSVTTITNFTSGREYVLSAGGTACAVYGPDQFYRFSFGGPAHGMTFGESINGDLGVWGFQGSPIANGISWTTKEVTAAAGRDGTFCLPLGRVTPSSALQWTKSEAIDTIPAGLFGEPAVCKKAKAKAEAMAGRSGGGGRIPGCGPVIA